MYQENEEPGVATEESGMVRSKVFIFHSVRSVLISKLKTESSQKQKYASLN